MNYLNISPSTSYIRVYSTPDGYEKRTPYIAIVTVTHLTGDTVYLSGGMGDLNRQTWESIMKLFKDSGVVSIMLERHGKIKTINL